MVVGITGHMDLGTTEQVIWVESRLHSWLAGHDVELGITCLAPGADQVFARICIEQSIPFRVIIPCAGYSDLFPLPEKNEAERLLSKAQARLVQDLPASEQAFWEAGKMMVGQCDLVLAVWDGKEARGLGGTGDVVRYACDAGKPVYHFHHLSCTTEFYCGSTSINT